MPARSTDTKAPTEARQDYSWEQDVSFVLGRTARAYRNALDEELAACGITVREAQVLGWLYHKRDLAQCQLAQLLSVEPATLVGVLERMERDGLIRRVADRSDRRRRVIGLGQAAEEFAESVVECLARVCALAVQGLSPEEIDVLRELLKRTVDNLAEHRKGL